MVLAGCPAVILVIKNNFNNVDRENAIFIFFFILIISNYEFYIVKKFIQSSFSSVVFEHLRQGELVMKNPKKLPINILLTGLLVIAQVPDLHPTK
jgi:hypothetical protein